MSIANETERVIAYVDGFNLYFGMKESGYNDTLWLDIQKLTRSLLKNKQELVYTKYFTSRIRNNPEKEKRQKLILKLLKHYSIVRFILDIINIILKNAEDVGILIHMQMRK